MEKAFLSALCFASIDKIGGGFSKDPSAVRGRERGGDSMRFQGEFECVRESARTQHTFQTL